MNENACGVSVIVPVYNGEKYIDDCLYSITNQTYSNLEILICDDNSSDKSFLKLKEWEQKDNRIVVLKNNTNLYAAATRNRCFKEAKGYYFLIQDIDDYSELNRVECLLDAITEEGVDFVSSPVSTFVDDINKPTGVIKYKVFPTKYGKDTASVIKDIDSLEASGGTNIYDSSIKALKILVSD